MFICVAILRHTRFRGTAHLEHSIGDISLWSSELNRLGVSSDCSYQYSVYSWIARLSLEVKQQNYDWIEVNPFAPDVPHSYLSLNPFKRVPTLVHDKFHIYETGAITRYIDEAFPGPSLQPADPRHRARCNQFLSIIDSYVYWPFVRQVFSHSIFRPYLEQPSDAAEVQSGLESARDILAALEMLVAYTEYLCGAHMTLADIHLAPMVGYFAMSEDGSTLLKMHCKLTAWWSTMSTRTEYRATMPRLQT